MIHQIHATLRPDTGDEMFVFAVTNPLDNLVQLGLSIETPMGSASTNISVYYTNFEKDMRTKVLTSFIVPQFVGKWTRYGFIST